MLKEPYQSNTAMSPKKTMVHYAKNRVWFQCATRNHHPHGLAQFSPPTIHRTASAITSITAVMSDNSTAANVKRLTSLRAIDRFTLKKAKISPADSTFGATLDLVTSTNSTSGL